MKGQNRSDIKPGKQVGIVTKENQISNIITEGVVQDILTKSLFHPHGIKSSPNVRGSRQSKKSHTKRYKTGIAGTPIYKKK